MSVLVRPDFSVPFASAFGSFSANITQAIGQNSPTIANFDTTEISNDVLLSGGNRITVVNGGVYEISFSPQLFISGANSTDIVIWIRLNGNDVPRTSSVIELGNNNRTNFPYISFILAIGGSGYVQLLASSTTAIASFENYPAKVSPPDLYNAPSNPALIASVKRIG